MAVSCQRACKTSRSNSIRTLISPVGTRNKLGMNLLIRDNKCSVQQQHYGGDLTKPAGEFAEIAAIFGAVEIILFLFFYTKMVSGCR